MMSYPKYTCNSNQVKTIDKLEVYFIALYT